MRLARAVGDVDRTLLRDLGWVFAAEAAAGVLALLYVMVVAKYLSVSDYGLLQAMLGIFAILTALAGPLGLATAHCARITSGLLRHQVVGRLVVVSLSVGTLLGACVAWSSPWLGGVLHSGATPFVWVALLIPSTIVLAVFYAALQASRHYALYGVLRAGESLVRLIAGWSFLQAGSGVSGVLLGYILGSGLPVAFCLTRRGLYSIRECPFRLRDELRTFVDIALVYSTVYVAGELPVVLARWRLGAVSGGLYGALHGLRRMVLPFCLVSAVPLYSRSIATTHHGAFWQVLAFVLALGIIFVAVGVLMPELPVLLVYGAGYAEATQYVAFYGVALCVQMLAIVTMFHLTARRMIVRPLLLLPVISLVAAGIVGRSVSGLLLAQIGGWGLYLLIMGWWSLKALSSCTEKSVPQGGHFGEITDL